MVMIYACGGDGKAVIPAWDRIATAGNAQYFVRIYKPL